MKWENEKKLYLRRDVADTTAWLLETKEKHGYSVACYLHGDNLWDIFGRDCSNYLHQEIRLGERIEIKLTLEVEDEMEE